MKITIDGPAGSGKSTTARLVANRLGFTYLDTGAMYRAVTWLAIESGFVLQDGNALAQLARQKTFRIESQPDLTRIWIDVKEITQEIRSIAVTKKVSIVAGHPQVRDEMVRLQRKIAAEGNFVVEGRDIGSVVFPEAELKIFMQASLDARARRRHLELQKKGVESAIEEIKHDIARRDELDSGRTASPLIMPTGAVVIDTTALTIDEQVDRIVAEVTKIRE